MSTIEPIIPVSTFEYLNTRTTVYSGQVDQGLPKHQHTFSHLVACLQGTVQVHKENASKFVTVSDAPLLLTANEWHEIVICEPNTVFINQMEI
jgi:hypothetical protein